MKVFDLVRYVFSVPAAFACAYFLSGVFSILYQYVRILICNSELLRPFFSNCTGPFNSRLFLFDVVFCALFIYLAGLFAPKYKKQYQIVTAVLCAIYIVYLVIRLWFK